jgi:hypothetical protein
MLLLICQSFITLILGIIYYLKRKFRFNIQKLTYFVNMYCNLLSSAYKYGLIRCAQKVSSSTIYIFFSLFQAGKSLYSFVCASPPSASTSSAAATDDSDEVESTSRSAVEAVLFSPADPNQLITGTLEGVVTTWDISTHVSTNDSGNLFLTKTFGGVHHLIKSFFVLMVVLVSILYCYISELILINSS